MSEASRGRRETNPLPRQQRRAVQALSQASPLADGPLEGRNDTSSRGSTQSTPPASETNTEPIRRDSPDGRTRFLSLEASWESAGASSSTEVTGPVCIPRPPAPVSLSPRSVAAPTFEEFEDFIETDLFEGLWSNHEMTGIDARPALTEGAETRNLHSPPQEFRLGASEASDVIFNVNSDLPFGVNREEFFPALVGTIPPPQILAFYPLGSPSRFSAAGETGAIPPLRINPATGTPPPAALPINPQVTLAPPLGSGASFRPQQDLHLPGCYENLVAAEQNLNYSSGSPVPRFRTMSQNPWVVAAEDIPVISGASMAGGCSTVARDPNFGGLSLDGIEDIDTDGIEGGFIPISAITRPGFSDETLFSHSGTNQMQEWAGSAYRNPAPPVSSSTNTRYSSAGEPYLDPAVDPHHRRLSRASTASQNGHSYPINPLRIDEPLVSNIPPPPTIVSRATYSSYPPLPLPPREKTYRPWSMDVSEDGTQFISLGDCDLSGYSRGSENGAGSEDCIGELGGPSNAVGGRGSRIGGSKSGTRFVIATPPVEALDEYKDGSDSSSQQPVTKKQRTCQQRQQTHHTPMEITADDERIADGSLLTGGKFIPSWMSKAVVTEVPKCDAGTRKEQKMTPTKRDRKTQQSNEAVLQRVMKNSTTAAEELTLTGKAGVTPTDDSTQYKREDDDKMDDDSFLASEERAVTPAPRRLTPVVEIIVPAVPRSASKVLTEVGLVPEKRRSRGRPRKFVVSDEAITSEQNTITDARLYTDPVVALGWLVPYNRGEPICLPGCESLPGTIGCLRCFDRIFPGRREREGLMNPEMVFRRLRPGTSSTALPPREAKEVQGLHSLPALPKASANKRLPFPALKKEAEALSSLSDPPKRRTTPTTPLRGLSERTVKKRPFAPGEASGVRVVGRWSVPPNWEPPLTRAAAEVSPQPTAKAVSTLTSTRRSSLSTMPTKNTSPALRERRSTISTLEPQALEKQTPGPASSRKTRGSTPARRKLPARDSRGKFILPAGKTADTSGFTVEVKTTPKRTLRSNSKKPPPKKKAVATLSDFYSKHSPEFEDESGSEGESKPEDSSEAEDGSEYKA